MPISTISQKGQITLPSSFRKKLGMRPHDRVLIEANDEAIVIRPITDIFQLEGFLGRALPQKKEQKQMLKTVSNHVKGVER